MDVGATVWNDCGGGSGNSSEGVGVGVRRLHEVCRKIHTGTMWLSGTLHMQQGKGAEVVGTCFGGSSDGT